MLLRILIAGTFNTEKHLLEIVCTLRKYQCQNWSRLQYTGGQLSLYQDNYNLWDQGCSWAVAGL